MSWLERIRQKLPAENRKKSIPEGVWTKCNACNAVLYKAELERHLSVCPKCGYHLRVSARQRLGMTLDKDNRFEIAADLEPVDLLKFKDLKKYKDRISAAQKASNEKDALLAMHGSIHGVPVVAVAFDFTFMGGSMGAVVGEKFVQAANYAMQKECGLICFAASGGARMQEALFSLFQMAKTSAILAKLSRHGLPFISIMTDPTMGGVSASLAMLGDVNMAEPNALIGFAGPRVIEQTVREKLPEGFQRSEFLLEKGAIDMIVARKDMRAKLATLLAKYTHQPSPSL